MSIFIERLREQLFEHNMTVEQLEIETSISSSNIYKWLRNESIPNLDSLTLLSRYFKCSIDFLTGRLIQNNYSPNNKSATFSIRLRTLINKTGFSNYKFANINNIPRTSLHHWLTGRSQPLMDNLIKLADYLDVSIDFLVGIEN